MHHSRASLISLSDYCPYSIPANLRLAYLHHRSNLISSSPDRLCPCCPSPDGHQLHGFQMAMHAYYSLYRLIVPLLLANSVVLAVVDFYVNSRLGEDAFYFLQISDVSALTSQEKTVISGIALLVLVSQYAFGVLQLLLQTLYEQANEDVLALEKQTAYRTFILKGQCSDIQTVVQRRIRHRLPYLPLETIQAFAKINHTINYQSLDRKIARIEKHLYNWIRYQQAFDVDKAIQQLTRKKPSQKLHLVQFSQQTPFLFLKAFQPQKNLFWQLLKQRLFLLYYLSFLFIANSLIKYVARTYENGRSKNKCLVLHQDETLLRIKNAPLPYHIDYGNLKFRKKGKFYACSKFFTAILLNLFTLFFSSLVIFLIIVTLMMKFISYSMEEDVKSYKTTLTIFVITSSLVQNLLQKLTILSFDLQIKLKQSFNLNNQLKNSIQFRLFVEVAIIFFQLSFISNLLENPKKHSIEFILNYLLSNVILKIFFIFLNVSFLYSKLHQLYAKRHLSEYFQKDLQKVFTPPVFDLSSRIISLNQIFYICTFFVFQSPIVVILLVFLLVLLFFFDKKICCKTHSYQKNFSLDEIWKCQTTGFVFGFPLGLLAYTQKFDQLNSNYEYVEWVLFLLAFLVYQNRVRLCKWVPGWIVRQFVYRESHNDDEQMIDYWESYKMYRYQHEPRESLVQLLEVMRLKKESEK